MTRTELNSLRMLSLLVALGWLGQIAQAVGHGGIGAAPFTWFARACWLVVTAFVAAKYWRGSRQGILDE
jgi:hypothetical protein